MYIIPVSLNTDITLNIYHYDEDVEDYVLESSSPLVVDRTLQQWSIRPRVSGQVKYEIACGDIVKEFYMDITSIELLCNLLQTTLNYI